MRMTTPARPATRNLVGFALELDEHFIARGGVETVIGRDVNICDGRTRSCRGSDESAAGGSAAENADDAAERPGLANDVAFAQLDPAPRNEFAQRFLELGLSGGRHTELPCQRPGFDRPVAVAFQSSQDLLFESGH